MNIFRFIRTHKLLIGSILGIGILIAFVVVSNNIRNSATTVATATPKPTPPPPVSADWGNLSDIVKKFGTPEVASSDPNRTDTYKSKSANRRNEVMYQENVPVFARQIGTAKDTESISSIQKKYGDPEVTLYSANSADSGISLYAYPDKGIAYQASGNVLYEIWYFRPMSEAQLKESWAKDFSDVPQAGSF